jgi:hypothetical protein
MDRRTFNGLRNLLVAEGNLKKGLRICEGEKLLIFIHILRGDDSTGFAVSREE